MFISPRTTRVRVLVLLITLAALGRECKEADSLKFIRSRVFAMFIFPSVWTQMSHVRFWDISIKHGAQTIIFRKQLDRTTIAYLRLIFLIFRFWIINLLNLIFYTYMCIELHNGTENDRNRATIIWSFQHTAFSAMRSKVRQKYINAAWTLNRLHAHIYTNRLRYR